MPDLTKDKLDFLNQESQMNDHLKSISIYSIKN